MSDSDLLRRGDVKAVVREAFSHKPHPHLDLRYQEALAAIDAVPAAADGRWEIEINRLIAEYNDSIDKECCKNDTGDETLGLVVLDLEKIRDDLRVPAAQP